MDVLSINSQSVIQEFQRVPKSQLGTEEFLQILTAQIKYQDPLSGEDSTTNYINQMVQMNTLEQMQNINDHFSQMIQYQNLQYGSSLIGKNVTLNDGEQILQGVVDRVKIVDGSVQIIVDNVPYRLEQITEIQNKDIEEAEL